MGHIPPLSVKLSILFLTIFLSLTCSIKTDAQEHKIPPQFLGLLLQSDLPDTCASPGSPALKPNEILKSEIRLAGDVDFIKLFNPNFYVNSILVSFPGELDLLGEVFNSDCLPFYEEGDPNYFPELNNGIHLPMEPGQTYYLAIRGSDSGPVAVTGKYTVKVEVQDGFSYLTGIEENTPLPNTYAEYKTGTFDPYGPEFGDPLYEQDRMASYTSVDKVYYATADPDGKRTSLNKWLRLHGFIDNLGIQQPDVIEARYINAHDLGFGRNMKCLPVSNEPGVHYPCVVDNYFIGPAPESPAEPEFFASVAMELIPVKEEVCDPSCHEITKRYFTSFYVYDSAGRRIDSADLDGSGGKRIPESCWSCHYGSKSADGATLGAYLPFDLKLYQQFPGGPSLESQAENFRQLNAIVYGVYELVKDGEGSSLQTGRQVYGAIAELIEYWYGDTPPLDAAGPPESWFPAQTKGIKGTATAPYIAPASHGAGTAKSEFYARYCRICHVALLGKENQPYERDDCFLCHNSVGDSALRLQAAICGEPTLQMPNAKVTHKRLRDLELDEEGNVLSSEPGKIRTIWQLRASHQPFCSSGKISDVRFE